MKVRLAIKRMSATSIMTSKSLHTLYGLYKTSVYHSGSALVLILHEQIRLPPQNAQNLALKPLNGGTFGYKKDERHFNCDFQVFAHIEWVI